MNQVNTSDEWLMRQVARGRREHLETLVRRYASPLLTYIQRMVGDRHRAEELFQDAFLAVWEKRRTYRFPRPFRPWLFSIAINRCRQSFRQRSAEDLLPLQDVEAQLPAADAPTPVQLAVATERARLVASAIAALPPQQRTVVVLRNWNGLSYTEIAEIVRCGEATVRSHMHHALAGMRRYLEPRMRSEEL